MAAVAPVDRALSLTRMREDLISGRARSVRVSARLSQGELAAAVGTVRSTICAWEQHRRLPRGELALRYAAVLAALERRGGAR